MTTRARKQPERRNSGQAARGKARRQPSGPGPVLRGLRALGRLAARHPTMIGGGTAFAVVFSFVSVNALWYQPGGHPSPFLKTRGATSSLGFSVDRPEPQDVTTFVIEREDEANQAGARAASALILDIQRELARQGFYTGAVDGAAGARTTEAIRAFEERRGFPVTGVPSETLLSALQASAPAVSDVLPAERPFEEVKEPQAATAVEDPVAAAILNADADPAFTAAVRRSAPSEMVMQIQKGLSNIAYADIAIDGVAGERTRNAIRHFEQHYRLPQTGEPNEQVLKKLKEIGAL